MYVRETEMVSAGPCQILTAIMSTLYVMLMGGCRSVPDYYDYLQHRVTVRVRKLEQPDCDLFSIELSMKHYYKQVARALANKMLETGHLKEPINPLTIMLYKHHPHLDRPQVRQHMKHDQAKLIALRSIWQKMVDCVPNRAVARVLTIEWAGHAGAAVYDVAARRHYPVVPQGTPNHLRRGAGVFAAGLGDAHALQDALPCCKKGPSVITSTAELLLIWFGQQVPTRSWC